MTISNKLSYLNDTKTLLRESINQAGGSITEETPFRDYPSWVDYVAWLNSGGMETLFSEGEAGVLWGSLPYFVDTEGTTEATWGDPVGLIRDASPNRVDFAQPTVTARPILGRVPRGGRRNLYTNSQPDIQNSQWTTIRNGEGSTVTRIGTEPGPNGVDGIRYQIEKPSNGGYSLVGGNLTNFPAGEYMNSQWVKSGDGETYAIVFYSQSGGGGIVREVGPEWQRLAIGSYRDDVGSRHRWCGLTGATDSINRFADIVIADGQFEEGTEATPFQQVTTAYDITEEGVEDVHFLSFDLTDDNLANTLPAIEHGTVAIAGTNGIWIDDDYNFEGGAFSIGPTTYTNGPDGILEVIGDPLESGLLVLDRQLTSIERGRVITRMKQLGAPGVFPVAGVEHGYINANSTASALVNSATSRTTTWFSVSEWQGSTITLSPIGGNTNRNRAQFRDASGVITYANLSTSTFPVSVEVPMDAVSMRVYFRAEGAAAIGLELIP